MPYKLSRCVCIETPDKEKAVAFYHGVLGLEIRQDDQECTELDGEHVRFFIDEAATAQVVFEFMVPDAEQAKEELVAAGCTVVRWEGKGKCCYMRDPFGLMFNLWEVA